MTASALKRVAFAEALKSETLTPFGHALAGALGGVVSNALIYPLDTVKTRIQGTSSTSDLPTNARDQPSSASRKRKQGVLDLLLKIWREEGIDGFFRGFGANMLNTFSQQFAYFFWHNLLRTRILRRLSKSRSQPLPSIRLSTSLELLLGALAGAFAQIFTIPVAVIATRQQLYEGPISGSTDSASKGVGVKAPGFLQTGQEIVAESGWTGLWTGLKPGLVLTANPAITYGVFERVKGTMLASAGPGGKLSPGMSFTIGVLSKTLATVVTYPYIFAKIRLQAKHFAEGDGKGSDTQTDSTSPDSTSSTTAKPASTAPPQSNALQLDNASLTLSSQTPPSSHPSHPSHSSYAAVVATDPPHAETSGPHGHFVSAEDIELNTIESKGGEVPLSLSERTPGQAEESSEDAKKDIKASARDVKGEVEAVGEKVKDGAEEVKEAAQQGQEQGLDKLKEKAAEVKEEVVESAQKILETGKAVARKAQKQVVTKGALQILQQTYEREGLKGWYVGMQAQILKAVLTQGILFALKNQFERYALILILLAKRSLLRSA